MDQGPVVNISGQVNPQTIDVIGPPTAPTLTSLQYPNGTVAVTCNSTHGHPPPQIQWYQLEEKFTPDRDMVSRGTACLQEMNAYCLVPSVSETLTVAGNISAFYRCETVHSTGSLSSPSLILLGLFDIGDVDLTPGHSSLWKYAGVGVGAALIIASLVVMANFDRVSKRCRKKAENTESDRQPKGQYIDKRRSTESTDVYDIENETQLA
ncbi:uncharacterized protein LOC106165092 [Lingula anatina]|uniref:Uncharacterized protein LOC106165092 n=1 Tax=Lingula anatina TaxID=7574 RepID=A0A1S3IKL9_LINAN|nr:uncharacterized protein LOC106165092 [Lingula anatina]|eukprot:XP_013398638.1 uncharacterized protein LOC106165092 [Lingula anatina]